jgi:hypothetical protein
VVERGGAEQSDFLLRREEELDARVRAVLGEDAPRSFEHRRNGRLVVGAEDGAAGVAHDAVLDHGLERPLRRNRVEVRAQEDRRPVAVAGRLEPAIQVAHVRADGRSGVVLVDGQTEVA